MVMGSVEGHFRHCLFIVFLASTIKSFVPESRASVLVYSFSLVHNHCPHCASLSLTHSVAQIGPCVLVPSIGVKHSFLCYGLVHTLVAT